MDCDSSLLLSLLLTSGPKVKRTRSLQTLRNLRQTASLLAALCTPLTQPYAARLRFATYAEDAAGLELYLAAAEAPCATAAFSSFRGATAFSVRHTLLHGGLSVIYS